VLSKITPKTDQPVTQAYLLVFLQRDTTLPHGTGRRHDAAVRLSPPPLRAPLPFPPPNQALRPFTTFRRRLHPPPKLLTVSLYPRPHVCSSAFSVTAVDDDEDMVIGDCLVFDEDAFETPDLDLPSSPPPPSTSRPGRKAGAEASGGESLVPERWRDAVQEINLTKKEKRRIAHGLRFGSRLERGAPPVVTALDEFRTFREGRLQAEIEHVASVYRGRWIGHIHRRKWRKLLHRSQGLA
jgi:hypothetical protein